MFNDYQLLLLQKERERALAREWRNDVLAQEAKHTTQHRQEYNRAQRLKQTLIHTLTSALFIILLAFALTHIAWHNHQGRGHLSDQRQSSGLVA